MNIKRKIYLWKRCWRFFWQKKTRGWSDEDTWSLDLTIAEFVLPRLKKFREVNNGFPGGLTEERWNEILDKMIFAIERIVHQFDECENSEETEVEKTQEGLELFGKYFRNLWW